MTEPTLLQQARRSVADAYSYLGATSTGGLREILRATELLMLHLEQREAAMRGPAQVPGEPKCKVCGRSEPQAFHSPAYADDDDYHDFEPETPDEARVRLQRELSNMAGQFKSFDLDLEQTRRGRLDEPKCQACERPKSEHIAGWHSFVPPDVLDLDALQRLCDAATPGPWTSERGSVWGSSTRLSVCDVELGSTQDDLADALFIAAARDALPKLIARVRQLERRIAKVDALGAEFANDPAVALRCIGEHLDMCEHYDRHPNAPRDHA